MRALLHLAAAIISALGALIRLLVHAPLHVFRARRYYGRHGRGMILLAGLAAALYYITRRQERVHPPRVPPVIDV